MLYIVAILKFIETLVSQGGSSSVRSCDVARPGAALPVLIVREMWYLLFYIFFII